MHKTKGVSALVVGGHGGIGTAMVNNLKMRYPEWQIITTSTDGREGSIALDIESSDSVSNAANEVKSLCQDTETPLQVLINVAGFLHTPEKLPERRLLDIEDDFMRKNFEINAYGWLRLGKYFSPIIKSPEKNEWCLMATLSARVGSISDNSLGGWYSYRASKAAQNQFNKTMSVELGRKKIGCVSLHPGTVETPFSAPFSRNVKPEKLFTPDFSSGKLLDVLQSLEFPKDNGTFYDWNGKQIPF